MHGSSEAAAPAARKPAQVILPPRDTATREERAGRSTDQPQRVPRILHLGRRGAEGLRKIPGPHSRLPRLILPSPAWPDGEHAPLAEITLRGRPQGSTGSRRGPAQTSRGCDSRRLPGLPREEEGRACSCRLLPQGLRRVWPPSRQYRSETRWTVRGGAALQEKQTYFNRLLAHQLPNRGDALPPDARPAD